MDARSGWLRPRTTRRHHLSPAKTRPGALSPWVGRCVQQSSTVSDETIWRCWAGYRLSSTVGLTYNFEAGIDTDRRGYAPDRRPGLRHRQEPDAGRRDRASPAIIGHRNAMVELRPENPRAIIDRRGIAERLRRLPPDRTATVSRRSSCAKRWSGPRRNRAPPFARTRPRPSGRARDRLPPRPDRPPRLRLRHRRRGTAEPMALVGLGGTGRGEMAPFSDLDLMFLTAAKPTPAAASRRSRRCSTSAVGPEAEGRPFGPLGRRADRARQEGHDRPHRLPRSAAGCGATRPVRPRRCSRFRKEIVAGTAAEFVAAKLAERDERHVRMGDSRYVVEPNVKDGKGGLRDLHTLYWIGKYVHGVERPADLVGAGLLTAAEFRSFERAERFFWAVRCHLHLAAGRAEERLGFDHQRQIAEVMHYADRPGKSAVERFMQFYFLNAKTVGDLTGLFLAQLDEQLGEEGLPLRAADDPPAAQAPRRLHARPRAPVDSRRRFLRRRPGAAARAVRARRARAAGDPSRRRCAPRPATRG